MAKPIIRKGTHITCPKCKKIMVVAVKHIYAGETMNPENFKSITADLKKGQGMKCPFCDTSYGVVQIIKIGKLHTEKGWR